MNITLSFGRRSLSFDGTPDEYQQHVADLVRAFWNNDTYDTSEGEADPDSIVGGPAKPTSDALQMTARAVATALGGDSGAELVYAAAAFLAVVEQRATFTRAQLLEAMKSATGFYKPTYSNNLTSYLDSLSKKGVLIETSNQVFAVKASELDNMVNRLRAAG